MRRPRGTDNATVWQRIEEALVMQAVLERVERRGCLRGYDRRYDYPAEWTPDAIRAHVTGRLAPVKEAA